MDNTSNKENLSPSTTRPTVRITRDISQLIKHDLPSFVPHQSESIPPKAQHTIKGLIRHFLVTIALRKPYREFQQQVRGYIHAQHQDLGVPEYSSNPTTRRAVDIFVSEQIVELRMNLYKEVIHSATVGTATTFNQFIYSTLTRYDMTVIVGPPKSTHEVMKMVTRHRRAMFAYLRSTATRFTLDMPGDISYNWRAYLLADSFEKGLSDCLLAMGSDRSTDAWISWMNRHIEQEGRLSQTRMDMQRHDGCAKAR